MSEERINNPIVQILGKALYLIFALVLFRWFAVVYYWDKADVPSYSAYLQGGFDMGELSNIAIRITLTLVVAYFLLRKYQETFLAALCFLWLSLYLGKNAIVFFYEVSNARSFQIWDAAELTVIFVILLFYFRRRMNSSAPATPSTTTNTR